MPKILAAAAAGALIALLVMILPDLARGSGLVSDSFRLVDLLAPIGMALLWSVPVIIGWMPRRMLLGKAKLSGKAISAFEIARAAAIGWPLLLMSILRPETAPCAVPLAAACSAVLYGQRIAANRIIAMRASVREAAFTPKGKNGPAVAPLVKIRRLNSALMLVAALLPAIATATTELSLGPLLSWLLPVPALFSASIFLCILGHQIAKAELDNIYLDHVENFIRDALRNGCEDLIHYAGGSVTELATIAARLKAGGQSPVVLARDISSYERAVKLGLGAVLARSISDLDRLMLPQIRRMHYVGNTQRAGHAIRFSRITQVLHLPKLPGPKNGFPDYLAMYDRVCAGGPSNAQILAAARLGVILVDSGKSRTAPFPVALMQEKGRMA